jgi:proline iminopeptidase
VSNRLKEIKVPTMLGAKYTRWIKIYGGWLQKCKTEDVTTNGSHCSQFDDPETYFPALVTFIKDVNREFK